MAGRQRRSVGPLWGATAPVESTVTMVSAPAELVGCTRRRPEGSHSIAAHSYSCQAKLLTDLAFVRKASLTYHWCILVSEWSECRWWPSPRHPTISCCCCGRAGSRCRQRGASQPLRSVPCSGAVLVPLVSYECSERAIHCSQLQREMKQSLWLNETPERSRGSREPCMTAVRCQQTTVAPAQCHATAL